MSELKVSEIDILHVKPKNGHIGFASFVINDSFKISDVGLYKNLDGTFRLRYPEKLVGEQRIGIFFPIKKDVAESIIREVEKEYERLNQKSKRRNENEKADTN